MAAAQRTVRSLWAETILTLSAGDLAVLADMLDASEAAREEALDRLWEVMQEAHTELVGLRRQLAEAHQRISDLEVELGEARPPAR